MSTFNAFVKYITDDPIALGLCIAIIVLVIAFILVLILGRKKNIPKASAPLEGTAEQPIVGETPTVEQPAASVPQEPVSVLQSDAIAVQPEVNIENNQEVLSAPIISEPVSEAVVTAPIVEPVIENDVENISTEPIVEAPVVEDYVGPVVVNETPKEEVLDPFGALTESTPVEEVNPLDSLTETPVLEPAIENNLFGTNIEPGSNIFDVATPTMEEPVVPQAVDFNLNDTAPINITEQPTIVLENPFIPPQFGIDVNPDVLNITPEPVQEGIKLDEPKPMEPINSSLAFDPFASVNFDKPTVEEPIVEAPLDESTIVPIIESSVNPVDDGSAPVVENEPTINDDQLIDWYGSLKAPSLDEVAPVMEPPKPVQEQIDFSSLFGPQEPVKEEVKPLETNLEAIDADITSFIPVLDTKTTVESSMVVDLPKEEVILPSDSPIVEENNESKSIFVDEDSDLPTLNMEDFSRTMIIRHIPVMDADIELPKTEVKNDDLDDIDLPKLNTENTNHFDFLNSIKGESFDVSSDK